MDSKNEQFGRIYDQYIDKIYRFVYLKVNSQETAEDVTSKVFLKGWEAFEGATDSIKNPGAFLYQIARNAVVDHYRDKGRANTVSADASPELADPGTNAQDMAILSADISVVRKALQKLKKEHQDIIIWHYLEDMSVPEIAELINKPAGTIRVMLHRGLKDLKDKIQEA
ncbi:MAG: RNA polymerase sigma factor [Candidatus Staskawiczbacteria bacterium]|nr:RNA polymerase sigma factor [Candidatus Staskawiczbacteria bacterium]